MVQATKFLLRWLYLNNLIYDRAEIQSIPYHHPNLQQNEHNGGQAHIDQPFDSRRGDFNPSGTSNSSRENEYQRLRQSQKAFDDEEGWKREALRSIAKYPPGSLRLLALDSLRLEIVHEFARELHLVDTILQQKFSHKSGTCQNEGSDGLRKAVRDLEIIKDFEQATSHTLNESHDRSDEEVRTKMNESKHGAWELFEKKFHHALTLQKETREYLPQLVSAILHSPPPLTQSTLMPHLDPLTRLRQLLITRCIRDPNLGIELCWLLEAEVGRAWKSLFEHRQQTGRRLIVVLPAEKAAVIAKIGTEKRSAFDLLQDVETATAYGVCVDDETNKDGGRHEGFSADEGWQSSQIFGDADIKSGASISEFYNTPRLPASLGLKRCSHFGDTMHFIDRLTQISLDLRLVPSLQRHAYLQENLMELNRRIRRRMVTGGDVSMDVEDQLGPYDWPIIGDVTADMLLHSVHLPLEPKTITWPGQVGISQQQGTSWEGESEHGVMRILNIVTPKCRILASRERCPYLVHCEVADTNLGGSDSRLFASLGDNEIGTTCTEAIGMTRRNIAQKTSSGGFNPYRIPSELLEKVNDSVNLRGEEGYQECAASKAADVFPRGGNQGLYSNSHQYESDHYHSPYDLVREDQLQQLHEHLQSTQSHPHYGPPPQPTMPGDAGKITPSLTRYTALLDRVYGLPWEETCKQIRQTSPFGKVKGWRLASFIMKAGEDIRREALVMQVISKMKTWFDSEIFESNRPYLRPYTIMCVGGDAGLLECVKDAKSIDEVKKETDGFTTLREYFDRAYGPPTRSISTSEQEGGVQLIDNGVSISFETAQDNFLRSLVGYGLVCYVLQIKDRHNANILLDREGHLMHIDFGFVLGDTPKMGKVPLFSERAPFKLTAEFWDVIGGWNFNDGGLGVRFCKMFEEAFAVASAHTEELVTLIESAILNLTQNPDEARAMSRGVRNRLRMRGARSSVAQKTFIMDLVNTALNSWGTSTYDWLQKSMNGYI